MTDTRTIDLGQFRRRNSRVPRAVAAPDAALGWRLDLTRREDIHLLPGGGDHGRCEGIEDASITENGLTMFARVDNRDNWLGTHDAWVDCSISLPVYRDPRGRRADPDRRVELESRRNFRTAAQPAVGPHRRHNVRPAIPGVHRRGIRPVLRCQIRRTVADFQTAPSAGPLTTARSRGHQPLASP